MNETQIRELLARLTRAEKIALREILMLLEAANGKG